MVAAHIVAVLVILLLPLPLSAALPCSSLSSAADCRRNGKLLPTPGLFYKKTENTTETKTLTRTWWFSWCLKRRFHGGGAHGGTGARQRQRQQKLSTSSVVHARASPFKE